MYDTPHYDSKRHISRKRFYKTDQFCHNGKPTSFFHCTQGKRYQYNGKMFYNFFGKIYSFFYFRDIMLNYKNIR